MTHPIIGLMGRKRHGKDSVAAVLVEKYGFKRFAFADALREAALALDPIVGSKWDFIGLDHDTSPDDVRLSYVVETLGWEEAKAYPEVRRTLQRFGTGIREVDQTFWVDVVVGQVTEHNVPAVITDVRFPDEYREIQWLGGTLVRVFRPGMPDDDTHISETALDNFAPDFIVTNDGTLADLEAETHSLAGAFDA